MKAFKYDPIDLEGPSFRLLQLIKGDELHVECKLFDAWLHGDDATSFEALSYTWGFPDTPESITVNGGALPVTENLFFALRNLRLKEIDRILWVDAVCIDQNNEKERGHQVQHMGSIYSQADRVIFWLGRATEETDLLMLYLRRLEQTSLEKANIRDLTKGEWLKLWSLVQSNTPSQLAGLLHVPRRDQQNLLDRQRRGLEDLLSRPWFHRVWILQEVVNAKTAIVCSGSASVNARVFALAPSLMGFIPASHTQAVLDIMPSWFRKQSWWNEKRDLYTLLQMFKGSKASDERDMIYALLGISSDGQYAGSLRADYTKTTEQLIRDASLFLFGISDLHYPSASAFVENFDSLDAIAFARIAQNSRATDVLRFREQRRGRSIITEYIMCAAAQNVRFGDQVVKALLKQRDNRANITEKVLRAAARNPGCGAQLIRFLTENGKLEITKPVISVAKENAVCGLDIMESLLVNRYIDLSITLGVAIRSGDNGRKVIRILEQRGEDLMLLAAKSGTETMDLFLQQRVGKVECTRKVLKAAADDEGLLQYLIRRRDIEMDVTDEMLIQVLKKGRWDSNVTADLLARRNVDDEITKEMFAAANHGSTASVARKLKFLLKYRGSNSRTNETLQQDHITFCSEVLGENHFFVTTQMAVLARIYEEQGRLTEAEALLGRAMELGKDALGKQDDILPQIMASLARTYAGQRHIEKTRKLITKAIEVRKRILWFVRFGDSPSSESSFFLTYDRLLLRDLAYLGRIYQESGQVQEAEKIMEEVGKGYTIIWRETS